MIRLFELDKIIKYKKGVVETKRQEFKRLQTLMKKCLQTHFRDLEISKQVEGLLNVAWSKSSEDQTDALFCALLGYLHWRQGGRLSKVVGSLEEGFILLPPRYRNGFILMESGTSKQIVTTELVKQLSEED